MRINLLNQTGSTLSNIELSGCEQKLIEPLNPNEERTVWVQIPGDCSITMEYDIDDQRKEETLVGYATGGSGAKIEHIIAKETEK